MQRYLQHWASRPEDLGEVLLKASSFQNKGVDIMHSLLHVILMEEMK